MLNHNINKINETTAITIFVMMIAGVLLFDNIILALIIVTILFITNFIICNYYININVMFLLTAYVVIAPFRNFISLHQPFAFPIALPLDILIFLMILCVMPKSLNLIKNKMILLLLVLYSWALLEIFNPNSTPIIGVLGFRNRTMGAIMFVIGAIALRERKHFDYVIKLLAALLSLVAVYGVFHFFLPTNAELEVYHSNINQSNYFMSLGSTTRRAFSTLASPGAFGVGMFFFFVVLRIMQLNHIKPNRYQFFILYSLNGIGLLLSGSRSSMIAVLAFLVMDMLTKGSLIQRLKKLAATFIIAIAALFLASFYSKIELFKRMLVLLNPFGSESTFTSRLDIWGVLKATLLKVPFGYGIGSTGINIASKHVESNVNEKLAVLTDNEYVTLLYEQGWIGCMLYVTFLVCLVYCFIFLPSSNFTDSRIRRHLAIFTVTYCLLGVPIQLSQIFPINIFVWMLWGGAYGLYFCNNEQRNSPS